MLPNTLPGVQAHPRNSRPNFSETFAGGGFFAVPNWIIDRLLPFLSPLEWAVLSVAQRQIAGWQKDRDAIALSQFYERVNAGRRAIREALDALVNFGALIRTEQPGKPPVYEMALADAIDWDGLTDRRNQWNAEITRRTIAGRKAAAKARGDIFADTTPTTAIPDAGKTRPPGHHTAPPPLPSHGRPTPAVMTAHTKNIHTQETQEGRKASPPAPAFACESKSKSETPAAPIPTQPTAPARATPPAPPAPMPSGTPLADAFDEARRAVVASAGVAVVPIPRADRAGIEAQLSAAGVTVAEVAVLVAWIAAHAWDKRRDLLRHAGPLAAEKVAVPLLENWRNDTGANPVPRIEPTANSGPPIADDPADAARRIRYLDALAAGRRPDVARIDAKIFLADVARWRREVPGFTAAEREAAAKTAGAPMASRPEKG